MSVRSGVLFVGRGAIDNFVFVVAFLSFFNCCCAVGFFFFVVGCVGAFVCRYAVDFFSFVIVTLISFRLSLRHWVLFVCRCVVGFFFCLSLRRWFPFVFRFVVVLLLGCWFLFVCLSLWRLVCWIDIRSCLWKWLFGVGKSFQIRGFMPKSRSGGDERVQKNHGGLAFRKKRVYESRVSTEMIATFCVVFV